VSSLRRTYVSIVLLATKFDVAFVQSQVGHADSKLTVDVYQQLLDRSKRAHGMAFDALVSDAHSTLCGAQSGEFGPPSHFGTAADICPPPEFGLAELKIEDGHGGFRNLRPLASEICREQAEMRKKGLYKAK
jgi:hypothetical protein